MPFALLVEPRTPRELEQNLLHFVHRRDTRINTTSNVDQRVVGVQHFV